MGGFIPHDTQAHLARFVELQEKLAARDGKPGYKKNCQAIRAEMARLKDITDGQAV